MWILVLAVNVLSLLAFYKIFSNRIVKNSALNEVVSKYRQEIDAIVKTFNKTSYENISLLEEKIEEASNLLKYLKSLKEEIQTMPQISGKESVPVVSEKTVKKKVRAASGKGKKNASKPELVLMYFNEGSSVKDIAEQLDISEHEVKLYIRNA